MKTRKIAGRYDPVALRAALKSQSRISCSFGMCHLDILLATPIAVYALTPLEYQEAVFPLTKADPGVWTRLRSGEMQQDVVPHDSLEILRKGASETADGPALEAGPLRLACGRALLRPLWHPGSGSVIWIDDALMLPLADSGIEFRGTGPRKPVVACCQSRPVAVLMPAVVSGAAQNAAAKAFYETRKSEAEQAARLYEEVRRDGPIWD